MVFWNKQIHFNAHNKIEKQSSKMADVRCARKNNIWLNINRDQDKISIFVKTGDRVVSQGWLMWPSPSTNLTWWSRHLNVTTAVSYIAVSQYGHGEVRPHWGIFSSCHILIGSVIALERLINEMECIKRKFCIKFDMTYQGITNCSL